MFAAATARLQRPGMGHGCGDGTGRGLRGRDGGCEGLGALFASVGLAFITLPRPRADLGHSSSLRPALATSHGLSTPRPPLGAASLPGLGDSSPGAVSLLSPATSAVPIISGPEDPIGAGRAILGPPECQTGAVGELLCCSLCTPCAGVSARDWGVGLVPQPCPQCPGRSHRATGMQPPGSRLRAVLLRFGDLILVLITSSAGLALTSLLSEEISHA